MITVMLIAGLALLVAICVGDLIAPSSPTPAEIADIAFHNKAAIYDLLFKVASETMITIAADPRHLGARIGITAVLHSWGSAMTQNPHS